MTKHWDLRGMNMAEVMATSAAALDETFDEMVDNAGKLCRITAAPNEIELVCELQRQWLEEERDVNLAKLRGWLERDCASMN